MGMLLVTSEEIKMALKTQVLTGMDKASVLMMSLGAATSAKIFEQLTPSEREQLGAHIAGLRHVDDVVRDSVIEEVTHFIKYGSREEIVPDSNEPLKWLEKMNAADAAKLLVSERAQNVALVLAHLAPNAAAEILSHLNENLRNQTVERLAAMKTPSREVVEAVDEVLKKRADESSKRAAHSRSRETLLGLLGSAKKRVKESTIGLQSNLENIKVPPSSDEISGIEDLVSFTDADIRMVISEINIADLCLAMRVASEDFKSAIYKAASEELALAVRREQASPYQARLKEIELAQERIVEVMREVRSNEESIWEN